MFLVLITATAMNYRSRWINWTRKKVMRTAWDFENLSVKESENNIKISRQFTTWFMEYINSKLS